MQIASCRILLAKHWAIGRIDLRLLACCSLPLLLALSAPGCKKSSGAVPVHGRVAMHGEPLANASVMFFPATGRPVGAAILNGEFKTELTPGEYTVTVDLAPEFPKGFKEGDPIPPQKAPLPEEYTSRAKSTLKAIVKAGQSDPVDFDLK